MRILVHDYAGHPFQVQLSRALAARGHDVHHAFSTTNLTPHGVLRRLPQDPAGFDPIGIDQTTIDKGAQSVGGLVARRNAEAEYGGRVAQHLRMFEPDVVLSANTPLDAEAHILRVAKETNVRFVKWLQDVISVGTTRLLGKRMFGMGRAAGKYYESMERKQLLAADHIVAITEDFVSHLTGWGVDEGKITVIENWAPLQDLPVRPDVNVWSHHHGLSGKRVFLYAGTLGMKHNPELLAMLAERFAQPGFEDVRVVVVSEGPGADYLAQAKAERDLKRLVLLPFQPFEEMPNMLGTATVLLALLEQEAATFSVPSKVLTAMCARRPILLSVPPENLVARIVERERAGVVVDPLDNAAFVEAAVDLLKLDHERLAMGERARAYAERTFNIDRITHRFEEVLIG